MSNFDKTVIVRSGVERRVVIGPEIINGDGTVWLGTSPHGVLSNAQARQVAANLIDAADYAEAVQKEMRHAGNPAAASLHRFEWTDPAWRTANEPLTGSDMESSDG